MAIDLLALAGANRLLTNTGFNLRLSTSVLSSYLPGGIPMASPANYFSDGQTLVPSDTVPQKEVLGIYVGGAGNVSLITEAEYLRQKKILQSEVAATIIAACTPIVFTAPPVGSILPVRAYVVKATGTTATLLIGLLP